MAGNGNTKAPTVVSALRAIVAAAEERQGGDTALQEIPKDLIADARRALAAFDAEFRPAINPWAGS